jgi:hypothetical protein
MVNTANFAANDRCYDPTDTTAFYTRSGTSATNYKYTLGNINTANGMSLFHENRLVGKAIYALNFETLNNDFSVISGVNTMTVKPFEVNFRSDNIKFTGLSGSDVQATFPRTSSMFIFCNYDMLIQLKRTGIQVLGRG